MEERPDPAQWAKERGEPWDAYYATIAWALRDQPFPVREAFLSVRQDGFSFADVARERGLEEEDVRQDVIRCVTAIYNALAVRARRRWDPNTPYDGPGQLPELAQPVDPDVAVMTDYLAGAQSTEEDADVELRMHQQGALDAKAIPLAMAWQSPEDYRDLVVRIDYGLPPRKGPRPPRRARPSRVPPADRESSPASTRP